MKDLETERGGTVSEIFGSVNWKVTEDLESIIFIDLLGGGISFVPVRVRSGRGGSEFGRGATTV